MSTQTKDWMKDSERIRDESASPDNGTHNDNDNSTHNDNDDKRLLVCV